MEEIEIFLYERIMKIFGCPLEIMIDQGTQFINKEVYFLTNQFIIKHRKATTYKSSTNG